MVFSPGKLVRIGLHFFLFGMKLRGFSLDIRSVEIADEILFGDWGVSGVGGPTYLPMRCLQGLFGILRVKRYTAKKMRAFGDQLDSCFGFFGEGEKSEPIFICMPTILTIIGYSISGSTLPFIICCCIDYSRSNEFDGQLQQIQCYV